MRLYHLVLTSALFALPAQAQDERPRSLPSLEAALPAEVRLLLASSSPGQSLFPVNGSEPFARTILKADVISFSANSELVLGATSAPFIIIAARDVKFPDTDACYRIRFETPTAANGDDGATSEAGGTGASLALPHVYLVVDHFSIGNDAQPRMINLALKFRGVSGGDGGRGGAGIDGADGSRGRKASSGIGCNHGGGDGSPGGDGGAGGKGGDGGRGGDGSSVTFVSTPRGVGQFGYASIQNQGGNGGANGYAGKSGMPGQGGPGGHGEGFCHGGNSGRAGNSPVAAVAGADGVRGTKGTVELISLPTTALIG